MLIITTAANQQILSSGKDRQPIIVQPENYDDWLAYDNGNIDYLRSMLVTRDYNGLVIQTTAS